MLILFYAMTTSPYQVGVSQVLFHAKNTKKFRKGGKVNHCLISLCDLCALPLRPLREP